MNEMNQKDFDMALNLLADGAEKAKERKKAPDVSTRALIKISMLLDAAAATGLHDYTDSVLADIRDIVDSALDDYELRTS